MPNLEESFGIKRGLMKVNPGKGITIPLDQTPIPLDQNQIAQSVSNVNRYLESTSGYGKYFDDNSKFDENLTGEEVLHNSQGINPYETIQEHRGQEQPWYDKFGNASVKMGLTTVTTFAESFTDLFVGIPTAIAEGRFSGIYDNAASDLFKDINAWSEKELPNYYTKAELEAPWYKNLVGAGAANFWADKFLKNVGFTIGAIGAGMVTAGIGDALMGISKSARIARGLVGVGENATKAEVLSLLEKGVSVNEAFATAAKGIRTKNAINGVLSTYVSAQTEAGIEAHQGKDDFIQMEVAKYKQTHNNQDPPEEELQRIADLAESVGNVRFGLNLPLLYVSDALQFGKAFSRGFKKDALKLNRISDKITGKDFTGLTGQELIDAQLEAAKRSTLEKVGTAAYNIMKNPIREGVYEEMGQFAIENGVKDYYDRVYNRQNKRTLDEMIHSIGKGLEESYGTNAGWEQGFIGGLTGALGMPGMRKVETKGASKEDSAPTYKNRPTMYGGIWDTFRENKEVAENTQKAVDFLNDDKTRILYANAMQSMYANQKYDSAVKNNDHFLASTAKFEDLVAQIDTANKLGVFDLLMDKFESMKNTDIESFAKAFGYDLQNLDKQRVSEIADSVIKKSREIKQIADDIDTRFRGLNEGIRKDLLHDAASISNVDYRTEQLSKSILTKTKGAVNWYSHAEINPELLRGEVGEKYDEAIDTQVENWIKHNPNPQVVAEVKQEVEDLKKLQHKIQYHINNYNYLTSGKKEVSVPTVVDKIIEEKREEILQKLQEEEDKKEALKAEVEAKDKQVVEEFMSKLNYEEPIVKDKDGVKYDVVQDTETGELFVEDNNAVTREITPNLIQTLGLSVLSDVEAADTKKNDPDYKETSVNKEIIKSQQAQEDEFDTGEDPNLKGIEDYLDAKGNLKPLGAKKSSLYTTTGVDDSSQESVMQKRSWLANQKLPLKNTYFLQYFTLQSAIDDPDVEHTEIFEEKEIEYEKTHDTVGIKSIVVDENGKSLKIDDNGNVTPNGKHYITNYHHKVGEFTNPKNTNDPEYKILLHKITEDYIFNTYNQRIDIPKGEKVFNDKIIEINGKKYTLGELKVEALKWEEARLKTWREEIIKRVTAKEKVYTAVIGFSNGHQHNLKMSEPKSVLEAFADLNDIVQVQIKGPRDYEIQNSAKTNSIVPNVGAVVVERGSDNRMIVATPRTLNDSEITFLAKLLNYAFNGTESFKGLKLKSKDGKVKQQFVFQTGDDKLNIVNAITNYGRANKDSKNYEFSKQYEIYFEKGTLYFGDQSIDKTEIIVNGKINEQLYEFLSTKLAHANRFILESNKGKDYYHPIGITEDGKIEYKKYSKKGNLSGYEVFLLKERLQTQISPKGDQSTTQFEQVYISYNRELQSDVNNSTVPTVTPTPINKVTPEETVTKVESTTPTTKPKVEKTSITSKEQISNLKEGDVVWYTYNKNGGGEFTIQAEVQKDGTLKIIKQFLNKKVLDSVSEPAQIRLQTINGVLQGKSVALDESTELKEFDDLVANNIITSMFLVNVESKPVERVVSGAKPESFNFPKTEESIDLEIPQKRSKRNIDTSNNKDNLPDVFDKEDITNIPFRKTSLAQPNYKPEDKTEEKWFGSKFSIERRVVEGLIEKGAFGTFMDAVVYLDKYAEKGTTYHEAFHAVFRLYLTDKQRQAIYAEYRNRPNAKQGLSELEIEEELAEEFREYMLLKETQPNTIKSKIIEFFERIWRFLKGLLNKDYTINDVYKAIDYGQYKNSSIITDEKINSFATRNDPALSRVKGLDVITTKKLIEGMNYYFMRFLYEDGNITNFLSAKLDINVNNLYNDVLDALHDKLIEKATELKKQGNQDDAAKIIVLIKRLFGEESDKEFIKDLIDAHKRFIRNFRIKINESGEAEENTTQKDSAAYQSSITYDTKSSLPNTVKLLLAGLPRLDNNGEVLLNELGIPEMLNFNETYNKLLIGLVGTPATKEAMIEKLDEVIVKNPEFKEFKKRLLPTTDSINNTLAEESIITQFVNHFAKTRYEFIITYAKENGNFVNINANSEGVGDKIRNIWKQNFRKILIDKGTYTDNSIPKEVITEISQKIKATKDASDAEVNRLVKEGFELLGINLSIKDFVNTKVEDAKGRRDDLKNALVAITEYYKENTDPFEKVGSKISGVIDDLTRLEQKYNTEISELQHLSPEGESLWEISLNTYLTLTADEINYIASKHTTYEDRKAALEQAMPWIFKDIYSKHSIIKEEIYKGKALKIKILEGINTEDTRNAGQSTSELDPLSRLSQMIQTTLDGNSPIIRMADRTIEYSFSVGKELYVHNLEAAVDKFKNYFLSELEAANELKVNGKGKNINFYNKEALKLPLFKDIASLSETDVENILNEVATIGVENWFEKSLYAKQVEDSINRYLKTAVNREYNTLKINGVFEVVKVGRGETVDPENLYGISKETLLKYGSEHKNLEQRLYSITETYTLNYMIGIMENFQMFLGNPAIYENGVDLFKRVNMFGSSKNTFRTGDSMDGWLNNYYSKKGNERKDGKLADGKIKTLVVKDRVYTPSNLILEFIKTTISREITDKTLLNFYVDAYKNIKATDGFSIGSFDELREMMLRDGTFLEKEDAWNKLNRGEEISAEDMRYFTSYKTQAVATLQDDSVSDMNVPSGYKHSIMWLLPNLANSNPELSKIQQLFVESGIGLLQFASGNKYGTLLNAEGNINQIFDENGKIDFDIDKLVTQTISYKHIGIQVNTSNDPKESVRYSTQEELLVGANIKENGEYLDEEVGKHYDSFLETKRKLINYLFKEFKKEIGYSSQEDFNNEEARNTFVDSLIKAAEAANANDNVLFEIEMLRDAGTFIDTLLTRDKVESIINGIVDKSIIKEKRRGGAKLLASSQGIELSGREDTTLQWYRESAHGGLMASECILPLPPTLARVVQNKYGTPNDPTGVNEFNAIIARDTEKYNAYHKDANATAPNYELDQKLLFVYGTRIPGQSQASLDFMRVVKFLPANHGEIIFTAHEMLSKTGADFDADKFTMYSYNFDYVLDNEKMFHRFLLQSIKDYLKEDELLTVKELYDVIERVEEEGLNGEGITQRDKFIFTLYNKALNQVKDIKSVKENLDEIDYNYKQSLENKILSDKLAIVSSDIFSGHLLTPIGNSNTVVKNAIKSEIIDANNTKTSSDVKSYKEVSYASITSPTTNLRKFYEFLSGKALTAIAALHQPFHTKLQHAALYIDSKVFLGFTHKTTMVDGVRKPFLGAIKNVDGIPISNIFADFLSAFVDTVKDPYIFLMNINRETVNTVMFMVHLGASMKFIVNFMAQPIIKDYVKTKNNEQSPLKKMFGNSLKNWEVKSKVIDKYFVKEPMVEEYRKTALRPISVDRLKGMLGKSFDKMSDKDRKDQIEILEQYLEYSSYADKTQKVLKTTSSHTSGLGKNKAHNELLVKNKQEVLYGKDSKFFGNLDKMYDSQTAVTAPYGVVVEAVSKMMDNKYLTKQKEIKYHLDKLKNILVNNEQTEDAKLKVMSLVDKSFLSYGLQRLLKPENGGITLEDNIDLFYGNNPLAKTILNIRNDKTNPLHNNLLLNAFYPVIQNVEGVPSSIEAITKKLDTYSTNQLIEAAEELEKRDLILANKLFTFALLQSGLIKSPISWTEVIPAKTLHTMFYPVIKELQSRSDLEEVIQDFKEKFFLNNPKYITYNRKLVVEEGKLYQFKPNKEEFTATYVINKRKELIKFVDYKTTENGVVAIFEPTTDKINPYAMKVNDYSRDGIVAQKANEAKPSEPTIKDHRMAYKMSAKDNLTGKDTSTLELSELGLRTATTRSYPLGKKGDIITFEGRPQKYIITQEPEKLTKEKVNDPNWIKQWSKKEQWTESYFKKVLTDATNTTVKIGSYQTTFQKIDNTTSSGKTVELLNNKNPYTKVTAVNNRDTDYIFTENAEAYTASQKLISDKDEKDFPYAPNMPKLNVTSVNNQAGIRTDVKGNVNPNAYGVVVKKYQQNKEGKFVTQEGVFKDTNYDFKLFTDLNNDVFKRLKESTNNKIVVPGQFALGKAALPLRFAKWLQEKLQSELGVVTEIKQNTTTGYSGYGLQVTIINNTISSNTKWVNAPEGMPPINRTPEHC